MSRMSNSFFLKSVTFHFSILTYLGSESFPGFIVISNTSESIALKFIGLINSELNTTVAKPMFDMDLILAASFKLGLS